uniref:Uncharacterized protein n=1 Tax=Sinocyclocheilus grahami TaxID=75366 RepID=A0A672RFY7_SINGR
MALFSSVFRPLFEGFSHFLHRRETPLRAQQCAAQEWALEREVKRNVKKEREMNEGEGHQNKAESGKFKEMQSLDKLIEGGSENREAGEIKKKERKLKEQKTTEPTPLLVEVKPQQTLFSPPVRSSFLKPIEGELPLLPSVSEDLTLPTVCFKPLPPVTRLPMHPQKPAPAPEEVSLPCSPLQVVPPRPTPAPDELFSLRRSQVSPPRQLVVPLSPTPESDEVVDLQHSSTQVCPPSPVKPQPSTSSLFEPPPQLMLIDIEDEETEYVEYTGKTFRACDLPKSEHLRLLEAEMKPRQMIAWLESDCEVLKEVWSSEVEEQTSKRKVALVLFTWVEDKTKKKEQKKILKEKEQREKRLLLARYRNDPKLKHLLINKHNCSYCSSE